MIAMLLLASFLGDTALDAVRQGLGPEMAQEACKEQEPYGCEAAALAKKDPARLQRVLEDIIRDSQDGCRDDAVSDDCDLLRNMDATASKVLAKHRFKRT